MRTFLNVIAYLGLGIVALQLIAFITTGTAYKIFIELKNETLKAYKKNKKVKNSPTFEANKHASSVVLLLNAIETSRLHAPENALFTGATIVKDISSQLLDNLLLVIKTKWEQSHFDAFDHHLKGGQLAEAYIYNYITQKTADVLESGHVQVYPGVLSSEGESFKRLFEHSIDRSIKLGIYSHQWADEKLRRPVYSKMSM